MALRKIREFGDEVLNKECKEVTKMTIRTKVLLLPQHTPVQSCMYH